MQMSYFKKIEYEIVPEESFSVIRNCSGCGKKTAFKNTKRFRVNANGNKLDVWLIYQCEHCKHTFNLTIYERQNPTSVPQNEYNLFLNNDEQFAEMYGRNLHFFKKNKAEIDFQNINYHYMKQQEITDTNACTKSVWIIIHNPYSLKIRPEKQISEVLGLSRSHVKKMMEQEQIQLDSISVQCISIRINENAIGQLQ